MLQGENPGQNFKRSQSEPVAKKYFQAALEDMQGGSADGPEAQVGEPW